MNEYTLQLNVSTYGGKSKLRVSSSCKTSGKVGIIQKLSTSMLQITRLYSITALLKKDSYFKI